MCEQDAYHALQAGATIPPVTDWTVAITIILAALGAILTALAIMIALLAIFGYRGIKDEANRIATEAANKTLDEYFQKQSLRDRIRLAVGPSLFPLQFEIDESREHIEGVEYTGEEQQDNVAQDNQ
jgi:hypothetical protein